jgi:hypothetical protein
MDSRAFGTASAPAEPRNRMAVGRVALVTVAAGGHAALGCGRIRA